MKFCTTLDMNLHFIQKWESTVDEYTEKFHHLVAMNDISKTKDHCCTLCACFNHLCKSICQFLHFFGG